MFCIYCGAKLEDGTKFCTSCGAKQVIGEEMEQTAAVGEETAAVAAEEEGDLEITGLVLFGKTFSKKVVTIAAAALAAVIIAVILLVALLPGAASAKGAAEEYAKAVFSCEADEIIAVMPTDAVKTIRKNNNMSASAYENAMDEIMESLDASLDYTFGARRSLNVKVTETEKLSRDELQNLKEYYADFDYGSISDARYITIEISLRGSEDSAAGTAEVRVVKQNGRWFIDPITTNPYSLTYAIS